MATWCSKLCALALALAMMPGAVEIVESAAHLMTEGHLAHASPDGDRHDDAGPEHGCTPIFHFCGCHANLAALGPHGAAATRLPGTLFAEPLTPEPRASGFWPAIDRPPRV